MVYLRSLKIFRLMMNPCALYDRLFGRSLEYKLERLCVYLYETTLQVLRFMTVMFVGDLPDSSKILSFLGHLLYRGLHVCDVFMWSCFCVLVFQSLREFLNTPT